MIPTSVFIAIYILSALPPLFLIKPIFRKREKPGATGLLIIILSIPLWSLALGVRLATETALQWRVAQSLLYLVVTVATIGVFLLFAEYTERISPTKRVLGLLGLYPLVTQVAFWTNGIHGRFYTLNEVYYGAVNVHTSGVLYWVFISIGYGLVAAGVVLIVGEILSARGIRWKQSVALGLGVLPPVVTNLLAVLGRTGLHWTPVGFVVSVFFISWALFRADFLDVVPVGRTRAVENMADPVVTVDADQRVVDCNPAARELFEIKTEWERMPAARFFEPVADVYEQVQIDDTVANEIAVRKDDRERYFDLDISVIRGPQDQQQGTLVVMREITALRERERELQEREQELDLLRQVQSRILRHNIRNDLGAVQGYAEVLADEIDDEHEPRVEQILAITDDLVSISNKTRTVERLVEQDQSPESVDLGGLLHDQISRYSDRYPSVRFLVDVPETHRVTAIPQVEVAIENIIENAVVHNDNEEQTVEVTLTEGEKQTTVVIADNGSGIPDQELAVLEEQNETALQHGSGVGLWLVNWVIRNSASTIEFETGESGTRVTINIPSERKGTSM